MKLFLIGTLLFSGGSAAAMQNEHVRENVSNVYQKVRERVAKRAKENIYENIKENGLPYPSEEKLEQLTEEQQVAIIGAIDQFNATYDWANMTEEEMKVALETVKEEMNLLFEELGLEVPENWMQHKFRKRINKKSKEITKEILKERLLEDLRENGIEYPNEERLENLTEEQGAALLAKIDEFNETYDWANMTEEEIMEAMEVIKTELRELREELDFPVPVHKGHKGKHRDVPKEEIVEESNEV